MLLTFSNINNKIHFLTLVLDNTDNRPAPITKYILFHMRCMHLSTLYLQYIEGNRDVFSWDLIAINIQITCLIKYFFLTAVCELDLLNLVR
jgi:hypothetical protein